MTKPIIHFILFMMFLQISNAAIDVQKVENMLQNEVYIRLTNGDNFTCELKDLDLQGDSLNSITILTKIGKTKVFASEIAEILLQSEMNRQSNRIFILPTAEPISSNHFIGNFELLFFYAGIGITDYVSITAGRSVIPGTPSEFQISEINAKATLYRQFWESMTGNMSVAVGVNHALLNNDNKLTHIYSAITFTTAKSVFTGAVFSKIGSKDFYEFKLSNGNEISTYPFAYEDGSFGLALGLDTRLSGWKDVHIISELWNSNIARPTDTGVLLGVRLANTRFSADFGLAFFTSPYLLPFTSFTWTPF